MSSDSQYDWTDEEKEEQKLSRLDDLMAPLFWLTSEWHMKCSMAQKATPTKEAESLQLVDSS